MLKKCSLRYSGIIGVKGVAPEQLFCVNNAQLEQCAAEECGHMLEALQASILEGFSF